MRIKYLLAFFLFYLVIISSPLVSASNVGLIESSTWQGNLTGVRFCATAFADINNDTKTDLILTGCLSSGALKCDAGVIAKVYINDGSTLTENSTWQGNLTGVGLSSVALGDIDNDGDLDLIATGCNNASDPNLCTGNIIIKVYINDGSTLTENSTWQGNLTGVGPGSIALGDIDNNGKLDLVIKGTSSSGYISKVYINDGSTLTENSTWQGNLTGVGRSGSISLGDADNDGDLDLDLTGYDGSNENAKIYTNNGTTLTENSTWQGNLTGWGWSANIFGDYDNDNDLDMVRSGTLVGDHLWAFKNNGTSLVVDQKSSGDGGVYLVGLFHGSLAFGDYDNDGDLDLGAMGRNAEAGRDRIYENNQTIFEVDNTAYANITNDIKDGSLGWLDVDNDSDLDLMMVGSSISIGSIVAKVYINNNTVSNTQPNASTSFSSSFANGLLTLTWGNGSDAETPTNGLYYNLRVGTTSGGNDVVSGVYGGSSNPTAGYFGNMMQRKSISLTGLSPSTTYYWSVQTIDTGLAKSNWSAEQNYTTATNIVDPVITLNSPVNLYNTSNATITFNVNVTDDSGLANVSLWGNWTGSFVVDETNSSNLVNGAYTFSKNLSSYGDGFYIWAIRACDTNSNCLFSSNRTFMIDNANPNVSLVSPANTATWTSSSTVTFTYNVSDLAITNCSLIIDSSIVETDSSITVNTNQQFSRSLSNAAYTWSVNCTDFTNHTSNSTTYSLTISYTAPTTGGGGGGPSAGVTYNIGSLTAEGATKEITKDDKVKFKVNETEQTAKITTITSINVTLNLSNIIFILAINETKKFDLNDDNIYDTAITLNSISDSKASLNFKSISEAIPAEVPKEEEKPEEEIEEEEGEEEITKEKRKPVWIPITLTILIIAYIIAYYFYKKKHSKKRKWQ